MRKPISGELSHSRNQYFRRTRAANEAVVPLALLSLPLTASLSFLPPFPSPPPPSRLLSSRLLSCISIPSLLQTASFAPPPPPSSRLQTASTPTASLYPTAPSKQQLRTPHQSTGPPSPLPRLPTTKATILPLRLYTPSPSTHPLPPYPAHCNPPRKSVLRRVLLMSGSALSPWAEVQDALSVTARLAKLLNCSLPTNLSDRHPETIACLRNVSAQELVMAQVPRYKFNAAFGPSVDGVAHQLVFTPPSPVWCSPHPFFLPSSFSSLPPLSMSFLSIRPPPSSSSPLPSFLFITLPPLLPHLSTSLFTAFVLLTFPFPIFPSSPSPSPLFSPSPSLCTSFAPLSFLSFSSLLFPPLSFPIFSPLSLPPSLHFPPLLFPSHSHTPSSHLPSLSFSPTPSSSLSFSLTPLPFSSPAPRLSLPPLSSSQVLKGRQLSVMFGVTEADGYNDLSRKQAEEGLDVQERNRMLRTYVRNNYHHHLQEIYLAITKEYTDWSNPAQHPVQVRDLTAEALSDGGFLAPLARFGETISGRADAYILSPLPQRMGSVFGSEVPLVFGAPFMDEPGPWRGNYTRQDALVSEIIMRYWTNFAKTGDPNLPEDVKLYLSLKDRGRQRNMTWETYDSVYEKYLEISFRPRQKDHYRAHKVALWNWLIPELEEAGAQYPETDSEAWHASEDPKHFIGPVRPLDPFSAAQGSPVNGSSRPSAGQFLDYTTALTLTVAIGLSLLVLNAILFAALIYRRDRNSLGPKMKYDSASAQPLCTVDSGVRSVSTHEALASPSKDGKSACSVDLQCTELHTFPTPPDIGDRNTEVTFHTSNSMHSLLSQPTSHDVSNGQYPDMVNGQYPADVTQYPGERTYPDQYRVQSQCAGDPPLPGYPHVDLLVPLPQPSAVLRPVPRQREPVLLLDRPVFHFRKPVLQSGRVLSGDLVPVLDARRPVPPSAAGVLLGGAAGAPAPPSQLNAPLLRHAPETELQGLALSHQRLKRQRPWAERCRRRERASSASLSAEGDGLRS
ncbi:putative neuroligin-4, X-linked-like [Penaeus vannamei]|uniref:Putative neuroligin-4, X-linked-like n=1 Tax=Penaeus vannamei TaxID=6689 RepID=A0A423SM38_PENVA|nr:putative neuroligin-4, X-linked-like [Penaeus vannamei]